MRIGSIFLALLRRRILSKGNSVCAEKMGSDNGPPKPQFEVEFWRYGSPEGLLDHLLDGLVDNYWAILQVVIMVAVLLIIVYSAYGAGVRFR